jgi:hypothetical protein
VWWFSLLPLVLQHIRWAPPTSLVVGFALWGAAQLHWLAWGYALEFMVSRLAMFDNKTQVFGSHCHRDAPFPSLTSEA